MASQPLLSFTIPTYNFGAFIGDTIESIETGARELKLSEFEILVLDGGSSDDTDEVIEKLRARYSNIRYFKNSERGGIDRDLNTVAGYAEGEYIWLFSADDLLIPGWDKHVLGLLERKAELLLVPAYLCDINMKPLRPNPIFRDCDGAGPVQFDILPDNGSLDRYLESLSTLEALFSFMTAVIVKRDVWHGLAVREDYFGTCWAHCARLMPLLSRSSTVVYVNQYLIRKRGGNDSFLEKGFVARIGIAVNGWTRIFDEFFPDPEHKRLLIQALRKDVTMVFFIYAKLSCHNRDEVRQLHDMARTLYADASLPGATRFMYFLFCRMPPCPFCLKLISPVLPLLVKLRHQLKSLQGR